MFYGNIQSFISWHQITTFLNVFKERKLFKSNPRIIEKIHSFLIQPFLYQTVYHEMRNKVTRALLKIRGIQWVQELRRQR